MVKNYFLSFLFFCFALSYGYGQTYNQITTLGDLTDGNYLIVGDSNTDDGLMVNNTFGSVFINSTNITNPGTTITNGYSNNNVFNITVSGGVITIFNSSVGYASWGRSGVTGNHADFYNGTIADTERWTPTINLGLWSLSNVHDSSRILQWNSSYPRFVAYTPISNQINLKLYKAASSTPTITATPFSLSGMNYVLSNGPSTPSTTFNASGNNLTNDIIVTPPTNYEISINNSYWVSSPSNITLTQSSGTVSATTIYVRLAASLGIGNYNLEDIILGSISATTVTVACNGSVTGSNNSDIIAVSASESPTVSSVINDLADLTSAQGVQVWQITVRDGGASSPDSDNLSTILTDLTFAQAAGNQVTTWTDAIESIAVFNGTTRLATGNVTANQIQFTGMNVNVADNSQTTLSIRLSLQCPLGPDAFDNEDFVFSLSNPNTTFSPSGSGKTTFSAITSANGENRIDIAASELEFTTQPSTAGVNSPMNNIVVSAVDACGNIDTNFSGMVSLTSTGIMTGVPLTETMSSGQVTFINVVHTATGTNRTMTASATGVTNTTSSTFNITTTTTLLPGDLAILAVNTDYDDLTSPSSGDRISFVVFKDITINTGIYLTDNGYERRYANRWGSSEGVISITRTGSTLPAGSIITIETRISGSVTNGSDFTVYTCGVVDANWDNWALPAAAGIGGFDLNIEDSVWIMQGGAWANSGNTGSGTACSGIGTDTWHNSIYDGNVLYGWKGSRWDTTVGVCYDTTPGGGSGSDPGPKWSTIYPRLECFNTVAPIGVGAPVGDGKVKFKDPVDPDFSTTTNGRIDWIALINDTTNWLSYVSNDEYDDPLIGYDYKLNTTCSPVIIAPSGYVNGKWTGREDTNWFYCANWETFAVPDATVDVLIEDHPTFNNYATIDATATYADNYGNVAIARNLTISSDKVELSGSINNILEVNGDLIIDNTGSGSLDMDDGNPATPDGQLFVSGNWTNERGETAFEEGNGTVIFNGTAIQSITYGGPPTPPGPFESEIFYNVILDNDFDIGLGDRSLYMDGNLTINPNRLLNVQPNQFVHVGNRVTNLGSFNLEDSASLIQVENVDNIGNLTVKRNSYVKTYDYVYWSSPVSGFNTNDLFTSSDGYIFSWDPIMNNIPFGGSGQGYWVSAVNTTMVEGMGYISRAPTYGSVTLDETVFDGIPNNGDVDLTLSRGSDAASENDDWNLVGNPYPSSISAAAFLAANENLDGFINLWTHGAPPSNTLPDPFYENNNGSNYDSDDYITFNATGTTCSPNDALACFDGFIGSGQSFMVNTDNGGASISIPMSFKNNMRRRDYDNSNFFRSSNADEKHRVWLDLAASDGDIANRIVLGYVTHATMQEDRLYDAAWTGDENQQRFFSIIDDKNFLIQGRALPFSQFDEIPLGFNILTEGNYTIAINAVDGLFISENQSVYIKDNLLNITFNISEAPYTFNSEIGEFKNRFEIVFTADALSIDDQTLNSNYLTITELSNGEVQFAIGKNLNITNVEILDVVGRQVYNLKGNNSTERYNLSRLSKAAYIAKVTLSNGQVISKKAIKQQ